MPLSPRSPEGNHDLATTAAWGPKPPAQVRVTFRPWRNPAGDVLGFLKIELPSGLILNDCKLKVGPAGLRWIALPSVKRLDANGKEQWSQIVEFRDKETRERFQAQVREVLRQRHPELFQDAP